MIRPRTALSILLTNPLLVVWFEAFVRFGMALFVLPIALVKMQDVELSLWLLFNAMMALALLADSGLAPTLLRATAYFHAGASQIPQSFFSEEKFEIHREPNWDRIHAVIVTSGRLYIVIGFVSIILMGGPGVASVWNLMSMSGHNPRFWSAFALLVLWACVQVQIARWSGILQGIGKVAETKLIDSVASLSKILIFSAVLLMGQGVLGITIAGFVIGIVNLAVMRNAVMWSVPKTAEGSLKSEFDSLLFSRIWPATWRLGLISWGAYFVCHGSAIVMAQFSDTKQISSYLLTLRVVSLISQVARTPISAYSPNVVASLAKRDLEAFRAWTVRIVVLALSVYCVGFCVVIGAGNYMLDLIGSETGLAPTGIVLLLSFAYLFEMHHSIHASLYIATNHVPFVLPALLSGSAIVVFGLLIVPSYGLYGVVIVQIIVQALCNNWYPVYKSLGISKWRFLDYLFSLIRMPVNFLFRLIRMKERKVTS